MVSGGSGVAHSPHGLAQEVRSASSRVGSAFAQAGHQHVASDGGNGQQRVIAPLAGVVVALAAFLAQSIGLADGGVQVDGQRIIARSGPNRPGSSQQLSAHPIQLADVVPPETPQEGPQRGWRLDRAAQHLLGPASAQRVGVVNAVATGQCRRRQGQHLISRIRPTRHISQVNVMVHQLAQTQVVGQGHRQDQPSIGHQAVVIKGDVDAVGALRWQHPLGAPSFRVVFCFKNHYPRSREHFLILSPRRHTHLFGGLGLRLRLSGVLPPRHPKVSKLNAPGGNVTPPRSSGPRSAAGLIPSP